MRRAASALALALVPALASPLVPSLASAHVVSDRELRHVAAFPPGRAERALSSALPDSAGWVRPNRRDRWLGLDVQRPAALRLIVAAAHADTAVAERAWAALEAGFARQLANGAFEPAPAAAAEAEQLARASWLAATCRALIAVMNSALQDRFRFRYALLKPKLQRSVDALEAGADSIRALSSDSAGLLLATAAAFLLADGTYHDERYGRAGQASLASALKLQRPDGAFTSHGRASIVEHAVGLEGLQSIVTYFPSPTLERAAANASGWLRTHGRSRGARDGRGVTPGEIEFALLYAARPLPPPLGPSVPD
jgi:hypothetical protein